MSRGLRGGLLRRHRDFRLLWSGETTGKFGSRNVRSTLIEPNTVIVAALLLGVAWGGIRSHSII